MQELIKSVIEWGRKKGITNFDRQINKIHEEATEYWQSVLKEEGTEKEKLELGDILVTAIIAADIRDLDVEECLKLAYEKIKVRTGENRKGTFIKKGDLNV